MPGDSRTTTTLDIKVDARQLGQLERQTKQVFSRRTPEEFNRALTTIRRSLSENVREHERIVSSMQQVKRGTEAYKALSQDLKNATREARELFRALTAVSQAGPVRGGGAGGGGRGGGVGGAGGAGGAMRGLPGVQAPMPGMGAITTSLSAIPVAGAIAAGSLMAAAGTYQSALRYQQARLEATPFLMSSRKAIGFTGLQYRTVREQVPPEIASQRAGSARMGETGLTEMQLAAVTHQRAVAPVTGALERFGGFSGQLVGGAVGRRIGAAQGRFAGGLVTGTLEATGLAGRLRTAEEARILGEQQRFQESRYSLADVMGEATSQQQISALDARVRAEYGLSKEAAAGMRQQREGTIRERRVAISRPFDEAGMRAAGLGMGFAPAQALQMASQMAQAAGRPIDPSQLQGGMALQRTMGIGMEQTGQAMMALRRGGRGRGDVQEVADMIATAMVTGLEGSEIGVELGKQTSFLQQQASKGIRMDVQGMAALQIGLQQNVGLRGFRAGDITRQFAGGVSEVGFQGVQGPVQQRLLEAQFRVMGKKPGEGTNIEDYSEALFRMQSGQDIAKLLPEFLQSFQIGDRKDKPFFQARIFQQAMGQIGGARLGPQEALDLTNRFMTIDPSGQARFDLEGATAAAQQLVSSQGGLVKAEAGLEARRVGIGGEIAPAMLKLQNVTLNMAQTFNNLLGGPLKQVATVTDNWTAALVRSTEEMDNWLTDRPKTRK